MADPHLDPVIAAGYDDDVAAWFDPDTLAVTVDRLAEWAGTGQALEFAVGTGRVALPLAERGVPVHGIDLSEPMLDRLRAKPGAGSIEFTVGSMTTTRVDGDFSLVYLVFNTIMNLTSQEQQAACFANAAAHLRPGGHFVIETMMPALRRLPPGEEVRVFASSEGYLGFDEYFDQPAQLLRSNHYRGGPDGLRGRSAVFRYVWPSELDLMARMAGMEPVDRWEDWHRSPFTGDSPGHVSVWRRP